MVAPSAAHDIAWICAQIDSACRGPRIQGRRRHASPTAVQTARSKLSSLNPPPRPSLALFAIRQLAATSAMGMGMDKRDIDAVYHHMPPQAGVWKEYVKADGRKWYYNTETRVMQWTVPEPFCKLDEVRDYPRLPEITKAIAGRPHRSPHARWALGLALFECRAAPVVQSDVEPSVVTCVWRKKCT